LTQYVNAIPGNEWWNEKNAYTRTVYSDFLTQIETKINAIPPVTEGLETDLEKTEKQRKKVFSCFRRLGYTYNKGNKVLLDYHHINAFLKQYSATKNTNLNLYSSVELSHLISQLEQMIDKQNILKVVK